MSNQNLEALVNTLSAQVVQQGQQNAELLEKQLADMQKAMNCDFQIKNNEIFIKETVIGTDGSLNLEERVEALELALLQQSEAILTLSNRIGKSAECGDDVIFVDKLTAPPIKLRSY